MLLQKHLAVFYTHNAIHEDVLRESLKKYQEMVDYAGLPFDTTGVVVSINPVTDLLENVDNTKVKNVIAPEVIQNKGHLSIVEKIEYAMDHFPADFVSLHEHDVLYPKDYLAICQELLMERANLFDYVAYNYIIGVNHTGYVDRKVFDFPMSCLSFPGNVLAAHLSAKKKEIRDNGGWCYLEPGYAQSSGGHLRRLVAGAACEEPIVHMNMNESEHNHHFTNHFLTYEQVSKDGFNEWPGDLSHLFISKK